MTFVVDASIAAAWFLPDKQQDAADCVMADLRSSSAFVPALFWFETRNLFFIAERRRRLKPGEALLVMTQLRAFPLEDMGSAGDADVLGLALRHGLSAYDASYLALAKTLDVPLATLDQKLAAAAYGETVAIRGPLARA